MSEFKGTPGPWYVGRESRIFAKNELFLARHAMGFEDDVSEPNLQLMATAPELLEALQNLMDNYREFREKQGRADYPSNPLIQAAHDAINKALGK